MLGRREGGEVVTNPLKVCIFKPRRPPTYMWEGWGGIFHAVIVLLHDVDINIQSFHIRVFKQNNLGLSKLYYVNNSYKYV